MYLRIFKCANHKKSEIRKVSHLQEVKKSNKLFKSANLWICDLRKLFPDRPPLIVHNISYTSPLSQYSCLKMGGGGGGGTHLRHGAHCTGHCTGIVNASLYVTGKNSLNLKTGKQWQQMYNCTLFNNT